MAKVIKVENLSKAYQLGDFGTGTITRDFERFWARFRGKEDPFLKIGEANDRTVKSNSDVVWSLKDINFDIEQGEAVGIIGRNGAGKSTLLKLLSRVTSPTTGSIKIKGRIASLLEVGTGFHPELTGKENIYLNGAILGMRKAEIKRKFDEIVNFSGVERYIDTPVKRYSSGMYVRLAFAVAAHLESEILIVDEVLAVGDAEFQKKCLGKMDEVSKGEGRTVLFVSHNMSAINTLCDKGILLNNGNMSFMGAIKDTLLQYNLFSSLNKEFKIQGDNLRPVYISDFYLADKQGNRLEDAGNNGPVIFTVEITSTITKSNIHIGYGINDANDIRLYTLFSRFNNKTYTLTPGVNKIKCEVDKLHLKPDDYKVLIFVGNDYETIEYYEEGVKITVSPFADTDKIMPDKTQGPFLIDDKWQ